jgi:hypothetical protein
MRDRKTGEPVLDDDGSVKLNFGKALQTSCTVVVSEGMVVRTNTPLVLDSQKDIVEFLLTSHPLDCPICDKGGECPLQNLTIAHGPDHSRMLLVEQDEDGKARAVGRVDRPGSRALHPVRPLHPLPGGDRRRPGHRLFTTAGGAWKSSLFQRTWL